MFIWDRAQPRVLSVCHSPLAPDSQIGFLKQGSDPGRASATTTNSRQTASSEHPKQQGIERTPFHRHLLQGEESLFPTTACQVGCQAENQGGGLPFKHSTLPSLTRCAPTADVTCLPPPQPLTESQLPLLKTLNPGPGTKPKCLQMRLA